MSSFITAKCIACAGTVRRISNVNPHVICVDCKREFKLTEIVEQLERFEVRK